MTLFEVLDEIGCLVNDYNVIIEVTEYGLIIKKYFDYNNMPHCFKQIFNFEIFKMHDVEDCILEFNKRLEIELEGMRRNEKK